MIRWFCRLAVDSLCPWAEAGGWGCPLSPCVTLAGAKRRELCSCSAAFDGAAASDRVFGVALKAVSKRTRSEQVSFPLSLCYVNTHLHHVPLFPLSGSGVWALRSVGLGPAPLEPQPRVLARALRGTAQCSPLWQGLVCHSLHKTWGKSGTSRSKLQMANSKGKSLKCRVSNEALPRGAGTKTGSARGHPALAVFGHS